MNQIKLDDRLKSVVCLLNKGKYAADIGADHGILSNYLVENNYFEKVYPTEVSENSILYCKEFTKNRGNTDRVIPLVGKGLTPILNKLIL